MRDLQSKFELASKLQRKGQLAQAQAVCTQILARVPDQRQTLLLSAMIAGQLRDFARALSCLDRALVGDANNAVIHCNRALVLQEMDRLDEAFASYARAIGLKRDYALAHFNRGLLYNRIDRSDSALADFDRAIALNPRFPAAHYNRGVVWQARGGWTEALASYDQAILLHENYAEALTNRGVVLRELGRTEAAVASYERAITADPTGFQAYLNRGVALESLDQPEAALGDYDHAFALRPQSVDSLYNKGLLLAKLGRWDEALGVYNRALEIEPGHALSYLGRGILWSSLARVDEALADFDRALQLEPDLAKAHFNRALLLLSVGQLEPGWVEHEWRWCSESNSLKERRDFVPPLWLGETSVANVTVLIYAEQGLGDTLQFCRYAERLADAGARVILEVQKSLMGLLASLPGVSHLVPRGAALPEFDVHCPLMSLPLAFKTTLATIPGKTPYLVANPLRVEAVREKLGARRRPRIGLAWSGSPTHGNDANRSVPLHALLAILPESIDYFCLQKEIRAADRERLLAESNRITILPGVLATFEDTAALCECLDLVISIDTSIAHLSGALGKKTWILLSFIADWRWLRDRHDSPWYPTAVLFRQETIGDWSGVLDRIAAALRQEYLGPVTHE